MSGSRSASIVACIAPAVCSPGPADASSPAPCAGTGISPGQGRQAAAALCADEPRRTPGRPSLRRTRLPRRCWRRSSNRVGSVTSGGSRERWHGWRWRLSDLPPARRAATWHVRCALRRSLCYERGERGELGERWGKRDTRELGGRERNWAECEGGDR